MSTPENVKTSTLANGLRIVTAEMENVETISAGVWIEAGGRFEAPSLGGVSHMLEHMTFKGTHKRSALAIAVEIEAVGGNMNAYTSRENTAYYAKTLKEDLGLAIDISADLVQHATLDGEELERERGVILQEISQAQDTPEDVVYDLFQATSYPDQPLGRPILGTAEGVSALSREALRGYMESHYKSGAMVLAAAGKLTHGQVVELAAQAFPQATPGKGPAHPRAHYQGGDARQHRDIEQVQLLLGFEGFDYADADYYAAGVLSCLFGGGMSSRLFQEVREKRGLAYSVYAFFSSYADSGLFGVYAGTGENDVIELVPVIADELGKLTAAIGESEILSAKAQMKASLLMNLESTSGRSEQLARQLICFNRTIPITEAVAQIDAVGEADLNRVASRFLATTPTVAALGPIGKLEDFETIRSRLN